MFTGESIFTRRRLTALAPILLIGIVVFAHMLIVMTRVVPSLQAYSSYNQQIETLSEQAVGVPTEDTEILNIQLENAQHARNEAANGLLTGQQIDLLLDRLYIYAAESDVEIISLQHQPADGDTAYESYTVRAFRLQVTGRLPNLMGFVSRMNEGTLPSIVLTNLSLADAREGGGQVLTFDLVMYSSPYASGVVMTNLVTMPTPTNVPVVMYEAMPTSEALVQPVAEAGAVSGAETTQSPPQSSQTGVVPPTPAAVVQPTAIPTVTVECVGAPPSVLQAGDTAVVDFNGDTRLNILSAPRLDDNPVQVLMQIGDNSELLLVDGPVCGNWRGQSVLYWQVSYQGVTGWVGEVSATERWLCPLDNPECVE